MNINIDVKDVFKHKLIKYASVGIINTIFSYTIFSILIKIGLQYYSAAILCSLCSILFNFKTIGHLVFKNADNKLIFKFFLVYAITTTLNILLLDVQLKLNINIYLASAVLLMPLGLLSFILNKTLVFKEA